MLTAFITSSFILSLFYTLMLFRYTKAWEKTKEEFTVEQKVYNQGVTILVAARNEDENIYKCLESLCNQDYNSDQIEIILLDDFSEDQTVAIAALFEEIKIIKLENFLSQDYKKIPNKKRAISIGVEQAKFELIITTDGDCFYPKEWLRSKIQFHMKTKAKMIASPVLFFREKSIWSKFLALDLISLMGITAADLKKQLPSMVNGANLMFVKKTFLEVGGYSGNENIASGDDVFLLQKFNALFPNDVYFLKNKSAIVYTKAPNSFSEFVQQRIRWTTKSKKFAHPKVQTILISNVLFYLNLVLGLFILPFFGCIYLQISLTIFALKLGLDYMFFKPLTTFFGEEGLMKKFILIEFLHLTYIPILAFFSLFSNYSWKGRKV